METTNFTMRIDKELKVETEELFENLGLSMSSAITIFLKQAVREQKIPFEISMASSTNKIDYVNKKDLLKTAETEIENNSDIYEALAK